MEIDENEELAAESLEASLDAGGAARAMTVWTAIYRSDTPNPVNPSPP